MRRLLLGGFAILLFCECTYGKVNVQREVQPIGVKTTGYSARIEPDGCMTNLALGGINFFAPGVSISRGSYFYQGGPLKLSNLKQAGDNLVEAGSDAAGIRYE